MKLTIFLAAVVITASAQEQYPQCLLTDCGDFLTIGINCGYDGTSNTLTSAQTTCICNAAGVLTAYQKCAGCLALDPNSTTTYDAWPTDCALKTSSVASRSGTTAIRTSTALPTGVPSGVTSVKTTPAGTTATAVGSTPTIPTTAPISPLATGGSTGGTLSTQTLASNAQASTPATTAVATPSSILELGYCGNGSCGPGNTNANTYKDSRDGTANSGGVKFELYRCLAFGGLVVGVLGWL